MPKVRVLLTDCQLSFMGCVYLALYREGYEIIAEVARNEEVIDCIEKTCPDVAILNVGRDQLAGIEIVHRLKNNLPALAMILIIDNEKLEDQLMAALESGANACLSKTVTPSELLDTIKRVVRGEYPIIQNILEPSIASRIISEFEISSQSKEKADNLPIRLLTLEIDILRHIANGNPIEEVGKELNISEDTIRQRLYVILGKLVANHRNCQPPPQPLLSSPS